MFIDHWTRCPPTYFMDSDVSLQSSDNFLHTGNQSEQIILLFLPADEDWFLSKFWKNLLNTLRFMSSVLFSFRHLDAMLLFHDTEASVFYCTPGHCVSSCCCCLILSLFFSWTLFTLLIHLFLEIVWIQSEKTAVRGITGSGRLLVTGFYWNLWLLRDLALSQFSSTNFESKNHKSYSLYMYTPPKQGKFCTLQRQKNQSLHQGWKLAISNTLEGKGVVTPRGVLLQIR